LSDSLSKPYRHKTESQVWFTDKYVSRFDLPRNEKNSNVNIWNGLNKLAKSDSVKYRWEKVWDKDVIAFIKEVGFDTPQNFRLLFWQTLLIQMTLNKIKWQHKSTQKLIRYNMKL